MNNVLFTTMLSMSLNTSTYLFATARMAPNNTKLQRMNTHDDNILQQIDLFVLLQVPSSSSDV